MANAEHLAILKEGVERWNAWRVKNEDVLPDLQVANLTEANLTGAILFGAGLVLACFGNTIIANANLDEAEGLDTCLHSGPSTTDSNTLAK